MASLLSLHAYFDRLMSPKGHEAWLGDDPVEWNEMVQAADLSAKHTQLFEEVDAFYSGSVTQRPSRPPEFVAPAPVVSARPLAPSAAPSHQVEMLPELVDLSEEDRASVQNARDPQARLQIIRNRQALDARTPLLAVLKTQGAQQADRNPARWTFPDGTVAMVKMDRQAWVEQGTLRVGQGATALWQRLTGAGEAAAMAAVAALSSSSCAIAPASVVLAPTRPRFVRRPQ